MSLFDKIKNAIFGEHGPLGGQFSGQARATPAPGQPKSAAPAAPAPRPAPAAPAAPAPAATPAARPVDVAAVLSQKAAAKGQPSNWHVSIVDLLQLLDLDSSLTARQELAQELNVHAGKEGSAEQNIALHKAVMKKLAEHGGEVPADMRD